MLYMFFGTFSDFQYNNLLIMNEIKGDEINLICLIIYKFHISQIRALIISLKFELQMTTEKKSALKVLEETSRTFYIPIVRLPAVCQQAVASAYLALRAIDEIEDHPKLSNQVKAKLLRNVSYYLQKYKPGCEDIFFDWGDHESELLEVTKRLSEWIMYCPRQMRARVADSTSSMADRMAFWAQRNWKIEDQSDLDAYTFSVAGAVGLILCEIWQWYEQTKTDRDLAIGYGRGLQSVNILLNSHDDKDRGVTFYPANWKQSDMMDYCRRGLNFAKQYMASLKPGTAAYQFCSIPLALADASLTVKQQGKAKLTRQEVKKICKIEQ